MKKIMIIGLLGLLCSCSVNKNTNEIKELKIKITELEKDNDTLYNRLVDCVDENNSY